MVRARVLVRAEFCAALRLANPEFTAEENQQAFGVCFSAHGHGHNYLIEVAVEGEIDAATGLVVDYAVLDSILREQVVAPLDHRNLNQDVAFLRGVVPSSENLCRICWERLLQALPAGLELVEIRLQESRDHEIRYFGPDS